ncbi:hypothetical protein CHS0354_027451 [Potamilus streckersoni]|uniref:PIF1/LRR1 pleckstrin homology domain-containing protein n=1 Tax=Potamilus streckersoni TaxID=2493646 RepID=A0AAE0T6E0_9BIVA|nr:hypothetical protein CHS0354_027451 [Potamilus streckersoni]
MPSKMRITCDIDITNRLLPSHNMKKPVRPMRAQVSIGKKPGNGPMKNGTLYMMVCTAKDKNGTKYLIKDNVEQIFAKYVNEGRATIRFREPDQDICISKADSLQLKNFLSVLRLAMQGKTPENTTLSMLAPASAKNVERPKSKLIILSRKEYPITTDFPSSLEYLQISQCKMKRIDSRIFKLHKLKIFDLSNNIIEDIPGDFGKLPELQELRMNINELKSIPGSFFLKENLQNKLCLLDLSNNHIRVLPLQICELRNLVNLKVDSNEIEHIPPTIGRLKKLKFFSAAKNKIRVLPAGFLRLQLENVDLFDNPFESTNNVVQSSQVIGLPSLMECCARSIRKQRVAYSRDVLLPHLCQYLDSARQCWCGNFCFQCSLRYVTRVILSQISVTVTAINLTGDKSVPVEGFLCSPQCLANFQSNPHAYWRRR